MSLLTFIYRKSEKYKKMKKITIVLLMLYLCGCKGRPPLHTGLEGKPIPSFNLLLIDSSTHLNTNTLPSGEPIVFFYFSPHCPFCRAQMQDIIDNSKNLKDIRFVLLTAGPYSELKSFYKHYDLSKYPNVTVGLDYDDFFGNYFKTSRVPYLALYDRDKKLKRVNLGKMYSDEIKTATALN
jgi:thiol-disulfide isomerase/thioredoxin